ncbi:hypothetical protein CJ030_MR3G018271 [Morella rubra]|uniref:Uncharacterized protein n=1 Tax=Morella rubra TaxID=262757 RepID=A0A6A1W0V5_9ROSI|nr:hypothetical protein CJ030_MR3G018271 [Morella rubra]
MEVQNKKGGILLLNHLALFLLMLILLDSSFSCGAAVLVKSNSSFRCDGRLEECMITENLELDFLMNPYVSRILQSGGDINSKDGGKPAYQNPCGNPQDPQYDQCIAQAKGKNNGSQSPLKPTSFEKPSESLRRLAARVTSVEEIYKKNLKRLRVNRKGASLDWIT